MGASEEFELSRLFEMYRSGKRDPGRPARGRTGNTQPTPAEQREYAKAVELLRVAAAVGPGLTEDEFRDLAAQVESIQAEYFESGKNRDGTSTAEYQQQIWQLPDVFNAAREAIVHYRPQRSASGEPAPTPTSNPNAGLSADDLSLAPPISTIPEQADLGANIGSALGDMVRNAAMEAVPDDHVRMYHGGRMSNGKHVLTSFMEDAASEAERAGQALQYIDLPKSHDIFKPTALEGSDAKPRFNVAYAPQDVASGLRNVGESSGDTLDAIWAELSQMASVKAANKQLNFEKIVEAENTLKEDQLKDFMKSLAGEDWEAQKADPNYMPEHLKLQPGKGGHWLDGLQTILDAIGVADPSPIVDLSNAGISLVRAMSDPERAGEHLFNAGISAVSSIPYVGDIAKLGKYALKGSGYFNGSEGGKGGGIGGALGSLWQSATGQGGTASASATASAAAGAAGGGEAAGAALAAAGESLVAVAGAAGVAALALGGVIAGFRMFMRWCDQVSEANKKLIEETRQLAKYNGELSTVYMQFDAQRYIRDVYAANAAAGPMGRLAGSQSRYEDVSQYWNTPYQQAYTDFRGVMTEVTNALQVGMAYFDGIHKILTWWYGEKQKDAVRSRTAGESAAEMFCELPDPILPPIQPKR